MFDDMSSGSGSLDSSGSLFSDSMSDHFGDTNPANGLPMMGCIDIEGNAYGCDSMSSSSVCDSLGSLFDW